MLKEKYKEWNETFKMKRKYSNLKDFPFCFYDLAAKYLPEDEKAMIIDVGCGECRFEDYLELWDKYENLHVLDGNPDTINRLMVLHKYSNVLIHMIPNNLPFENESIDYIFCGHLIEHLDFKELYKLFEEFDRVLKVDGIFVVSTPLLWKPFYGTLSHVKPYHPHIFENYFCSENEDENPSYPPVSRTYKLEKLVYRYHTLVDIHNTTGSTIKAIDFLIQVSRYILRGLGIKKYTRTGYTIIIRKRHGINQ